jgi:hypothetical protein
MLTNCASTVRRCRSILLFVGMVSLVSQLSAQDRNCEVQSGPALASTWGAIPAPAGDMIVGFYENSTAMVGLNHVYAESEKVTHRWRSFIPWMSSGIVSIFPSSKAMPSLPSRTPLFYVGHVAAWLCASEHDARWVHLVRADTKHNSRVVQMTSGWSAFSFHSGFTAREEIPLKFHLLSDTVYTIQPERPLDDGEYLVIFGPSALSGFEFQIACPGAHCD